MTSMDLSGVKLYYEETGSGEPVVFSHGIPTDYRAWGEQVTEFSKKYRTVAYSRRYAAPNKRNGDLSDSTIDNNAEDLKGLIEALGLPPVHLIGHSYGGFVSAYLAATHPSLIRTLTLVEPAISTLVIENPDSTSQMFSLLLRHPSVALSARRFQSRSLKPSLKALTEGQTEKAVELNVDGIMNREGAFRSFPDQIRNMMMENANTIAELKTKLPPFKAQLSNISCNTLVINGEDSPLWSRRIGEVLGGSLRHAEALTIPGCAHFPHIEKSAEFNEKVLNFISKNKAA